MKLLLESSIVFFGTLLAAALVALGEPAQAELQIVHAAPGADQVISSWFAGQR
jgi:hypothetical protein